MARELGHAIVAPRPALSPVSIRDWTLGDLSGIGFEDLPFAIRRGAKLVGRARGDVLITREGLSGPGVLDASRAFEPGDILELDFTGVGLEAFRAAFSSRVASSPRALAKTVLGERADGPANARSPCLPKRLAELLCSLAGCAAEERCAELKRKTREAIARLASEFPAEIAALGGFDKAMATAGGVSLAEVDPSTMGSRIVDGLYFAGEVLDYDGDTGGFNLQAAFSTANAAARAMAARLSSACAAGDLR